MSVFEAGGVVYGAADGRALLLDALKHEASSSEPKPLVYEHGERLARTSSGCGNAPVAEPNLDSH